MINIISNMVSNLIDIMKEPTKAVKFFICYSALSFIFYVATIFVICLIKCWIDILF